MDSEILEAARRLAAFDALGALALIALRQDSECLALRGVALAQLGDFKTARKLLQQAGRPLQGRGPLIYARCLAALGELELEERHLERAGLTLQLAFDELTAHGDRLNAIFVGILRVKHLFLTGETEAAVAFHATLDVEGAPARLIAFYQLVAANISLRLLQPTSAKLALDLAHQAAGRARLPPLTREIERTRQELAAPAARIISEARERRVDFFDLENLLKSAAFIVDVGRRQIRLNHVSVSLLTRPVLLQLCAALGRVSPHAATRQELVTAAFGTSRVTDSLRVRLRVETGRLRRELEGLAQINSTPQGYALKPEGTDKVAVILPPEQGDASAVLTLLREGKSWTSASLATATGASQRSIQRTLAKLLEEGRVEQLGRGRALRWVAQAPEGFATALLLDDS